MVVEAKRTLRDWTRGPELQIRCEAMANVLNNNLQDRCSGLIAADINNHIRFALTTYKPEREASVYGRKNGGDQSRNRGKDRPKQWVHDFKSDRTKPRQLWRCRACTSISIRPEQRPEAFLFEMAVVGQHVGEPLAPHRHYGNTVR